MKLLITGGAGYLGRELLRLADCEVVATYGRVPVPGGVALDVRDRAAAEAVVRQVRPALAAGGIRTVHYSRQRARSGVPNRRFISATSASSRAICSAYDATRAAASS